MKKQETKPQSAGAARPTEREDVAQTSKVSRARSAQKSEAQASLHGEAAPIKKNLTNLDSAPRIVERSETSEPQATCAADSGFFDRRGGAAVGGGRGQND